MRASKWVGLLVALFLFAASHAAASIDSVTLTAVNTSSDFVNRTAAVDIRVSNPEAIVAACFTLTYDTDKMELTSVTSDFFKTFAQQFQDAGSSTPGPEGVMVSGVSYDRPLVWKERTDAPAGAMVAAVKIAPEADQGPVLMTLHFTVKEGLPGEALPVGLAPSVIKNIAAGYPEAGEAVPMLRGYEASPDGGILLPELAVSTQDGAVTIVDESTTIIAGTLTIGGSVVADTGVTLYSPRTETSWTVQTDASGHFSAEITGYSASADLTLSLDSPIYGKFSGTFAADASVSVNLTNAPPDTPAIALPSTDALSLTPNLTASAFADASNGHGSSCWEIVDQTRFTEDGGAPEDLLEDDGAIKADKLAYVSYLTTSENWLTTLPVPEYVLKPGNAYMVRVRYADNCRAKEAVSQWSPFVTFTTAAEVEGYKPEGGALVPQDQLLTEEEKSGFSEGTVCLKNIADDTTRAISLGVRAPEEGTLQMVSTQTVAGLGERAAQSLPEGLSLPYGLVGFTLELGDNTPADGVVKVTLEFSEAVDVKDGWWKYDTATDTWIDYSDHAVFADDGRSVELELKDGGFGDFDGVKNGRILDPGGVGEVAVAPVDEGDADSSNAKSSDSDASSSGSGCFIGVLSN